MIRAPEDPLTGTQAARFGVYVHFPYCLSKCPYCDFASTVSRQIPQEAYTRAILRELALRVAEGPLPEPPVQSVFFGGGTPSLWEPRWVAEVLKALRSALRWDEGVEVTLEANPGAADERHFDGYLEAGVNRLSIGVQSFHPATLKALGRGHDGDAAVSAFRKARAAGFSNVSMDFIYGVHGQQLEQAVADAEQAVALGPEHLSAYALTLEAEALAEEVPLAKKLQKGELLLPPDTLIVEMADAVRAIYERAGLSRYEISNHARSGRHSRHNCLYWTGGEYLALGTGATGYLRDTGQDSGVRYTNPRNAEAYLAAVETGQLTHGPRERLGRSELFEERVAMGLRLSNGIDLEAACRAFGEPVEPRRRAADRLVQGGFAQKMGLRLALTDRGVHLHSSACAQLL